VKPKRGVPAPRRRVERIAFPFVAPVAQFLEDPPHHQIHGLGGEGAALQSRREVDMSDLDHAGGGFDAYEGGDAQRAPARPVQDRVEHRIVAQAGPGHPGVQGGAIGKATGRGAAEWPNRAVQPSLGRIDFPIRLSL